MIQLESMKGGAAYGGKCFQSCVGPGEVIVPCMLSRMEERDDFPRCGIGGGGAVGFVEIAARAGEREVSKDGFTAVDARVNVLDVEARALERLAHPAVFAAMLSTLANSGSQCGRDAHAAFLPSSCRA